VPRTTRMANCQADKSPKSSSRQRCLWSSSYFNNYSSLGGLCIVWPVTSMADK